MNPSTETPISHNFPVFFWGVIGKSFGIFRRFFLNYLILALVSYLPFLILDIFSSIDTVDLIEFFHGNFLDVLIFLTLPTVYMQSRVLPLATIQLFFQRFFASVVLISFVQLGILIFFTQFFAQISLGAILIGILPYIYLIFAGFFLIMENSPKLVSVRHNLLNSIKLTRTRFFVIFWNYIMITLLTVIPLFMFSAWYLTGRPEMGAFTDVFNQNPENSVLMGEKLLELIEVFKQPGFKWSRIIIHVLFRPIKSLFLCFLFLGIMFQLSPDRVKSFLGIGETDQKPSVIEEDPPENREESQQNDIH
ncbi:hypothetical protein KJ966_16945 [bacterium]|nr:hypothetical protein [bacterium]